MSQRSHARSSSTTRLPRALGRARGEQPGNAGSNALPSYIDVVGNLAQDTVIAGTFDIAPGEIADNVVAMFANPFAGGAEELLYIDGQRTLRWARHVNPVAGGDPGSQAGWSVDPVRSDVDEVVVVVHPDGDVWAFAIVSSAGSIELTRAKLTADDGVPGGYRWDWEARAGGADVAPGVHFLPVQYLNDRSRTPVVFLDDTATSHLTWYLPLYSGTRAWHADSFFYGDSFGPAVKIASLDSADRVNPPYRPAVEMVHLWVKDARTTWLVDYEPRSDRTIVRELSKGTGDVVYLAPWTHPHGGGLVEAAQSPDATDVLCGVDYNGGPGSWSLRLDQPLQDLSVWQDAEGLLHLYGRDAQGALNVVHQIGWEQSDLVPGDPLLGPVWDTHVYAGSVVGTTRPVIAGVARYFLDPYPDDMPDECVVHQGVPAGEAVALYEQSVRTSFWHEERVRLVPDALPTPYVVPRYEATLTVRNSYGGSVGACDVSMTADVPVDLEVNGQFYRTGAVTPVVLRTDARGQVTLRVVARSLNVPVLSVTVPGMSQSLTVNLASDVHRFLGGTDTLPNHQDGFTAQVVSEATVPGSDEPLFPGLAPGRAEGADWPPTADDLVAWCQAAFAVAAGTRLPRRLLRDLDAGEEVCGFTLQTRDPARPAFAVHTSADQLRALRESLRSGGVVDELGSWFGDVWQAIGDGVLDLAQATINLVDQTIELVVYLADEVEALFVCAWDDVVSAAHAVEAAFVALGAEIEKVIQWLSWVFSFKDALIVAKQVHALITEAPSLVKGAIAGIGPVVDGFFIGAEDEIRTWFDTMKAAVGDRPIGSLQGVTSTVPAEGQPDPTTSDATSQLQGPHANWFSDKMYGTVGTGAGLSRLPEGTLGDPITDLFDAFIAVFDPSDNVTELADALTDLADLFWNLFSGKDAASVLATEITSLLDLAETVLIWILKVLDDVVDNALAWAGEAVDAAATLLDSSLEDVPVISWLWDFVVDEAGFDRADYPFTVGMVGAFLVAYPFTVIWKIVAEDDPFPDGIPVPSLTAGQPVGEAELTGGLIAFQALQGVVQTLDFYLDMSFNNYVLSGSDPALKPSPFLLGVTSVAHFFAYVVGDHPWFWGYAPPADSHRVLPYARYGVTFVLNMIDLVSALGFQTVSELFEPAEDDPNKERKEAIFAQFVFLAGWMRIGVNIREFMYLSDPTTGDDYDPAAPTWYDWWNLWINITAYIQTATGFIRYLGQHPFETDGLNEIIWGALVVKDVIDVAGDVFSGVCTVIQPFREIQPLTIQHPIGLEIVFEDATQFQPYVSTTVIPVTGGWPYYTWDALDPTDPTRTGQLPRGLRFERLEQPTGWVGGAVQVVGTPLDVTPSAEGKFTLSCTDDYGPSATATFPAQLGVVAAATGVPQVSFTCSATSGSFPLTVVFTNTTTDAVTEVHWDFGDGQTSSEAGPSVTYSYSGTFTVTLACKNAAGWGAAGQDIVVSVPVR